MVWQRLGKEMSSAAICSGHIRECWEGTKKEEDLEQSGEAVGQCTRCKKKGSWEEKGLLVYQKAAASELSCWATVKVTYFRPGGSIL